VDESYYLSNEGEESVKSLAIALVVFALAGNALAAEWTYWQNENLMTDEVTATFAQLDNHSSRREGHPYVSIHVLNRQKDGITVFASITPESTDCSGACQILVRADDTAPRTFVVERGRGVLEDGRSKNEWSFRDPTAVIEYVRRAKRVRLQFPSTGNVFTLLADAPLAIRPLRRPIGQ
jgi:hypothetical protein